MITSRDGLCLQDQPALFDQLGFDHRKHLLIIGPAALKLRVVLFQQSRDFGMKPVLHGKLVGDRFPDATDQSLFRPGDFQEPLLLQTVHDLRCQQLNALFGNSHPAMRQPCSTFIIVAPAAS